MSELPREEQTHADRPLIDWLVDLNSKAGATRLEATAILLRAGSPIVPQILKTLHGTSTETMSSLWGETLLQTVYATWIEDHLADLQDAYFNSEGAVKKVLFETRGAAMVDFWIMCLCAENWKTREEAALMLGNLGSAAERAVEALHGSHAAEEEEQAKLTMSRAIDAIAAARA